MTRFKQHVFIAAGLRTPFGRGGGPLSAYDAENTGIETARIAAAQYLRAQGYEQEAKLIAEGQGDDFREVGIALALWNIMNVRPSPPTKRLGRRIVGEEC